MSYSKVVLITGVSSGIGESFIRIACSQFSDYLFLGIGRNNIKEFSVKNYKFFEIDLNDIVGASKNLDKVLKDYNKIDILINNAGFAFRSTVEDMDLAEMQSQLSVNVIAPIQLIQKVLPSMRESNSGHIINVSSIGSVVDTPTLGFYAATKSALDKISNVLRNEVRGFGIQISIFSPGSVYSSFGKNIKESGNIAQTAYSTLYESWKRRFRFFFKDYVTSEQAARELIWLMNNPRDNYFFQKRDRRILWAKRFLPHRLYNYLIFNYFYKDETK